MSIPDFQSIMLPFLGYLSDGKIHSSNEIHDAMVNHFNLSHEDKRKFLLSGKQRVMNNRIAWAGAYLKMAGLVERPTRGIVEITERGKVFLETNPPRIDISTLMQFEEFREFRNRKTETSTIEPKPEDPLVFSTPQEALEYGIEKINQSLEGDLLSTINECSPSFFEVLVVDLLVKMGYGGSRREAGEVMGKAGDEGIDGIIKEDKLGLDVIYLQAKRWENVVSHPEIQKFVGALQGQRAKKGIFITTSHFSKEAEAYARNIETKVVLIDGKHLARLMIDYGVGVSITQTIEVKKIDSDYFLEG